jgi:lysophospholipase L1-like esterase
MSFPSRSLMFSLVAVFFVMLSQVVPADDAPASLELIDGDRVVLLGGTFIERAQRYGWLDAAIQVRFPDRKIHVRNLGWSADTVFAESRGIFEAPSKGYQQMVAQVRDLKPTAILFHYGGNEAFQGTEYLETYLKQYERLLDDLAPTNANLVLLSPLPLMNAGPPLPDPVARNAVRAEFVAATLELAKRRSLQFVNLWKPVERLIEEVGTTELSDNGIHFTEGGYRVVSDVLVQELTGAPAFERSLIEISAEGVLAKSDGCAVAETVFRDGLLKFQVKPAVTRSGRSPAPIRLSATGLSEGDYNVIVNGKLQGSYSAADLALPVTSRSPRSAVIGLSSLREAIVEKNVMYFHRWRPQNITYLFLFRKHEQGQNAKEVDEFEPIVARLEDHIFKLKSAGTTFNVEITRSSGTGEAAAAE